MLTLDSFHEKVEPTTWGTRYMFHNGSTRFALYDYDDDPETLYFSNLYVDPKDRNLGYGNQILRIVEKYAADGQYSSIILNVKKNSWTQEWYERHGYVYLEDCEGEYEGNVWLIKRLG